MDIEAELASIFAMSDTPEFAHAFLLRQKPPINTVDLFANAASSSDEMHELAALPAGYQGENILPAEARLHYRGAVATAWRLVDASFKNKKSPNNAENNSGLPGEPIDLD